MKRLLIPTLCLLLPGLAVAATSDLRSLRALFSGPPPGASNE